MVISKSFLIHLGNKIIITKQTEEKFILVAKVTLSHESVSSDASILVKGS